MYKAFWVVAEHAFRSINTQLKLIVIFIENSVDNQSQRGRMVFLPVREVAL
jgi:hypothetical protein